MTPSPFPQMPMGQAATSAAGAPTGFPAMPPPSGGAAAPPAQANPPAQAAPSQQMPAPGAGLPSGIVVRMQPDGTSVYVMPSPTGDPSQDVILGLNPPVKIPKAFQPQAPQGAQ